MIEPVEVVARFARVARPVMRRFMDATSCIASARTTIELMKAYGLRAVEIPVCYMFHVPVRNYARISGFNERERAQMRAECLNWQDDPKQAGDDYWNGHLVVLVEDRWLLDPSIDQANSTSFGVFVPPEVFAVDLADHKWRPNKNFQITLGLRLDNGDEASLIYRRIKDRTYLESDAWKDEGLPLLAHLISLHMEKSK